MDIRSARNEKQDWLAYRYVTGRKAEFQIKLETEKIDDQLILAYAAAFQLILATSLPLISTNHSILEEKLQSALKDRKLTVSSYASLATLFLLLLINFVLFTHYNSANAGMVERVGRSTQNLSDVENINRQVKEKEALLDTLGWDRGINKSVLIDKIAQLLPPDISWQEAAINPVDAAHQTEQKSIRFQVRKIIISGTAQRIISVNEWVGRIKSQAWVKEAQLQSYSYNNELNIGQFTILISY